MGPKGTKNALILTTKIHLNENVTTLKNAEKVEIWTDKLKYKKRRTCENLYLEWTKSW